MQYLINKYIYIPDAQNSFLEVHRTFYFNFLDFHKEFASPPNAQQGTLRASRFLITKTQSGT